MLMFVLGYIRTGKIADGGVCIDMDAARKAIYEKIAKPLGLELFQAAEGIHRVANARMMRALRAVSTQRGRDPRGLRNDRIRWLWTSSCSSAGT